LFHVNAGSFSSLADEYKRIYLQTTEPGLKEEALFKWALLNSLYGAAPEAVAAVTDYGGKFSTGIFSNVAKSMREDLLLLLFRELDRAGNCQGLVKLALEHQPYLSRCVADSDFIPHLAACFSKLGMVQEELNLFSSLAETAWVGQNAPFLYQRIVENAWQLDDFALAAGAAKTYLSSYAGHGAAAMIRERLAWILYRNRDLRGVYVTLLPLMSGKGTVTDPESYYFFGKASENLGEKVRAEKAMERYLAAIPSGSGTALAADARLVMAAALQSRKATVAAIAVLQGGYDASTGERRDMFLFKMGELYQASGKIAEAAARWQKLVDEGKDPVWKSMAYQSLTDLQWQRKLQEPGTSK
jgi:hypothetical protein